MEMFLKNMNFSYGAVQNLLNEMHDSMEGRELEELIAILSEYQMDEDRIGQLINPEDPYCVFRKEGKEYVPVWEDFFEMEKKIPVYPNHIGRKALYEMAEDELVGMLLPAHAKEVIEENCNYPPDCVKVRARNPMQNQKADLKFFPVILQAILENRKIRYTSETPKCLFEDRIATPFRFLFSNRKNHLQLIVIPDGEERLVLINLSAFRKVEITSQKGQGGAEEFLESRKRIVVLEIEDHRNVVERSFSIFSHLKREARYDREKNIHILKVWYYDFDEKDMIRDILSLGPAVMVQEPESIRQKIYQEACGCVENYTEEFM